MTTYQPPKRIKRTSIINGITGVTSTYNYICSLGPWWDPHRDVVAITVNIRRPQS